MTYHYKSHPSGIEAIEITQYESFLRGNILKYVLRAPYKGSELADLEKAAEYLQWEIERVQEEQYLKRERLKDLLTRKSLFVDADENAQQRIKDLAEMREEWDEDYYDYYHAGMTIGTSADVTYRFPRPFDDVVFPDKCQECDGNCRVC